MIAHMVNMNSKTIVPASNELSCLAASAASAGNFSMRYVRFTITSAFPLQSPFGFVVLLFCFIISLVKWIWLLFPFALFRYSNGIPSLVLNSSLLWLFIRGCEMFVFCSIPCFFWLFFPLFKTKNKKLNWMNQDEKSYEHERVRKVWNGWEYILKLEEFSERYSNAKKMCSIGRKSTKKKKWRRKSGFLFFDVVHLEKMFNKILINSFLLLIVFFPCGGYILFNLIVLWSIFLHVHFLSIVYSYIVPVCEYCSDNYTSNGESVSFFFSFLFCYSVQGIVESEGSAVWRLYCGWNENWMANSEYTIVYECP